MFYVSFISAYPFWFGLSNSLRFRFSESRQLIILLPGLQSKDSIITLNKFNDIMTTRMRFLAVPKIPKTLLILWIFGADFLEFSWIQIPHFFDKNILITYLWRRFHNGILRVFLCLVTQELATGRVLIKSRTSKNIRTNMALLVGRLVYCENSITASSVKCIWCNVSSMKYQNWYIFV